LIFCAAAFADEWGQMIGQTDQVTRGLVAYYSMRTSGTTVFDEMGSNSSTASNVLFGYSYGVVGNGALFQSNQLNNVIITDGAWFNQTISTALTFSAWLYPASVGVGPSIVGKYNVLGDQRSWRLFDSSGLIVAQFGNATNGTFSGQAQTVSVQLVSNLWIHLCFVYSPGSVLVYCNGLPVATQVTSGSIPLSLFPSSDPLRIGLRTGVDVFPFDGRIDEARFYNRALSADEIRQLYRMGATPRRIKE
jgi:hypothetical protein